MTNLLFKLSAFSTLIPFITISLFILKFESRRSIISLWLLLCLASVTEIIMSILALMAIRNVLIFHAYTLIECILVLKILLNWQQNKSVRKWICSAIPFYIVIYFGLKLAGLEKLESDSYNFITRPIALIIMTAFIFSTLFEFWKNTQTYLRDDYRFWVLISLGIYYSSSIIIFSFSYLPDRELLYRLVHIHAILNITHNLLMTIGIFQLRKNQLPTFPPASTL